MLVSRVSVLVSLLGLVVACSGSEGPSGPVVATTPITNPGITPEPDESAEEDPGDELSESLFNGTFSGDIATTRGGSLSFDSIDLSMTARSPLEGTFFRSSDLNVATIFGDAVGNSGNFTGSIDGDCLASFTGTIDLMDDDTVAIYIEGNDCNGSFSSTGTLPRADCKNIAGRYRVSLTGNFGCTTEPRREVEPVLFSESPLRTLAQTGCSVQWVDSGNVLNHGQISGNSLVREGPMMVDGAGQLIFSENKQVHTATIETPIEFTLDGAGQASGTRNGVPFDCTSEITWIYKRCYDVAVAILRGGIDGEFDASKSMESLRRQAMEVNEARVFAFGIGAGGTAERQLARAQSVLEQINRDCGTNAKVVLVGHSLGGEAARVARFPDMCSRISIDPIQPPSLAYTESADQRDSEHAPSNAGGRFINVLSSTTETLGDSPSGGFLGYRITGAKNEVEPETDHLTLVTRVIEEEIVSNEVGMCLN